MRPKEKFKIDHRFDAFKKIKKFFWNYYLQFYRYLKYG
jgi:inosine/xanthosine triphosphate pyrophosphatase family protein